MWDFGRYTEESCIGMCTHHTHTHTQKTAVLTGVLEMDMVVWDAFCLK